MIVAPKEYRLVKSILQMLNEAYPTANIKIPAERWSEEDHVTKVIKFVSTPDPIFSAYKDSRSVWWLVSTDIYAFREVYNQAIECCKLIKQDLNLVAHPCHVHVTYLGQLLRDHKAKTKFFIGVCSWVETKH